MKTTTTFFALAVGLAALALPGSRRAQDAKAMTPPRGTSSASIQGFADTVDLQFLVRDATTLRPVQGAEVWILETGDRRITDARGVARFATPQRATSAYYPKGRDFEVAIVHRDFPQYSFVYATPSGCACPRPSRSDSHYDVRLGGAPEPETDEPEGAAPSGKECEWRLAVQEELACASHMENATIEDDAPALGCVSYVNGRPAGQMRISDTITTSKEFQGEIQGELGRTLRRLGFEVKARAGGRIEAQKTLVVDVLLGGTEFSGCSGQVCLRPVVLRLEEQEFCEVQGQWVGPLASREQFLPGQGLCLDTSGLDCD